MPHGIKKVAKRHEAKLNWIDKTIDKAVTGTDLSRKARRALDKLSNKYGVNVQEELTQRANAAN